MQLCSGAKDGTCKVWDLSINPAQAATPTTAASASASPASSSSATSADASRRNAIAAEVLKVSLLLKSILFIQICVGYRQIRLADGTMGVGSAASNVKLECRGCQFSSDGHSLYLIQSAKTGSTLLVRCGIEV